MLGTIYIDADGVAFDFTRTFLTWAYNNNKAVSLHDRWGIPMSDLNGYDFTNASVVWSVPPRNIIHQFQRSAIFAALPALLSLDLLYKLQLLGWDIQMITSAHYGRESRLKNVYTSYPGVFSRVHFSDVGHKRRHIKPATRGHRVVVIDDSPREIDALSAVAHGFDLFQNYTQLFLTNDPVTAPFMDDEVQTFMRFARHFVKVAVNGSEALATVLTDTLNGEYE